MDDHPQPHERPKSRVVAALLSLLAPGVGHAFVGRPLRGVVWLAAPLALAALSLAVAREPSVKTVFAILGASLFLGYASAIIDVLVMPARRHRQTSAAGVIAFVAAPVLLAPVVALTLRMLVVEAYKMPSGSMSPTLVVGDHLFVDKAVYRSRAPRRGAAKCSSSSTPSTPSTTS